MDFEKMSVNNYCTSGKNNLDDFILSQPCGYIDHFSAVGNYAPISSIYEQKGQFCDKQCDSCLYNSYPYTVCKTIFEKRKEQYSKDVGSNKMLNISEMYKTFLKDMNEKTLLHFAQLLVDEMEARGYGSKKN